MLVSFSEAWRKGGFEAGRLQSALLIIRFRCWRGDVNLSPIEVKNVGASPDPSFYLSNDTGLTFDCQSRCVSTLILIVGFSRVHKEVSGSNVTIAIKQTR